MSYREQKLQIGWFLSVLRKGTVFENPLYNLCKF